MVSILFQQFTYSDQYLTNYAGYTWDLNTPDRNASGTWQNCIQFWIRHVEMTDEYPDGAADDQMLALQICGFIYEVCFSCTAAVFNSYSLRGGVCGKLPDAPRT